MTNPSTLPSPDALSRGPPAGPPWTLVDFGPLRLEPFAVYKDDIKTLFRYNDAQFLLACTGLSLPTFRDVMEHVLLPGLEHRLDSRQEAVFADICRGYGEWTSDVLTVNGRKLYHAPHGAIGLRWQGTRYDTRNTTLSRRTEYDITGLAPDTRHDLRTVATICPSLVEALYGRSFRDLPERMRLCGKLLLPPDQTPLPMGRGGHAGTDRASRYLAGTFLKRAVRGARRHSQ